ncbi:MAG: MarR family winged helix-turn-helix transcriptional regulator [Simkaniaceae bacterium]|nr:MarR family winged helix-turn-helix transcriptional regulator [Simkaniaceae bacterium]
MGISSKYESSKDSPGYLLWLMTNRWQRLQRTVLEPLGLTNVQFVLLARLCWLTEEGEDVTQNRLAEVAMTDKMMTSQVVRTLEEKKLLTRDRSPSDGRARILKPTESGVSLIKTALPLVEKVDLDFFGNQLDQIKPILNKLSGL